MGSSGFAQIYWCSSGVTLYCTDSEVFESVLEELKKLIPSCRVHSKTELISGEIYHCEIDKLKGQDKKVGVWVMKQLCLQGWEPFESGDIGANVNCVKLRRSAAASQVAGLSATC